VSFIKPYHKLELRTLVPIWYHGMTTQIVYKSRLSTCR